MDFSSKPTIIRYPSTTSTSLLPYSSADDYILTYVTSLGLHDPKIAIVNDRFGYLYLHLYKYAPTIYIDYSSQEEAIKINCKLNHKEIDASNTKFVLDIDNDAYDLCLIKAPKSLDLLHIYLDHLSKKLSPEGHIVVGFMTKYFTPQMLNIASQYFGEVNQSLAWKKARLLHLKHPKKSESGTLINEIRYTDHLENKHVLKQYYGVFSARHIDFATQFLLKHLEIQESDRYVLDLASGNGIIASYIRHQNGNCHIDLIDDMRLAVASSKLNIDDPQVSHIWGHKLDSIDKKYDLIVTNPPFHFEHEQNIEISIALFSEAKAQLSAHGRIIIVANRHLNYRTHLERLFRIVITVNENEQFIIYECQIA